jgi:hypothetical protein
MACQEPLSPKRRPVITRRQLGEECNADEREPADAPDLVFDAMRTTRPMSAAIAEPKIRKPRSRDGVDRVARASTPSGVDTWAEVMSDIARESAGCHGDVVVNTGAANVRTPTIATDGRAGVRRDTGGRAG